MSVLVALVSMLNKPNYMAEVASPKTLIYKYKLQAQFFLVKCVNLEASYD